MNIVAVKKNKGNQIIAYKLDNETIVEKGQAVSMAENGEIQGVEVVTRGGKKHLRGSLLDLPQFE